MFKICSFLYPTAYHTYHDQISAVLYGTGFNVNTQVVLNAPTISENISPAYVSPDGTVLVCTIPPTVPAGEYTIGAINTFSNSTSTVSVRSNTMTVGVTTAP